MPSYGTTTAICPYTPPEPNVGLYYPALNVYDCLHTNPANPTPAISDFEYGFFYGLETLSLDEHDQHMEELVGDVQSTVVTIQTHTQFLFDDWPGVIGEFRGRHDQTQDGIASLAGTLGAHGNAISVVDDKVDDIASTLQSWSDPSGQLDQIQEQTADLPNALLLLLMFGVEADEVGLPPDPNLPGFEMVEQVSDLYQGLAALGEALDSHIAALMSQVEEKDQVIADLQSQLASMYTQEQVDAIVEITCPGNSESHGNP